MRLLVFSLLTKIRPVSRPRACAENRAIVRSAHRKAAAGMGEPLIAVSPAYALLKRAGKQQRAGVMHGRTTENRATAALLLDNVVKTYGPVRAVDGVSVEVH